MMTGSPSLLSTSAGNKGDYTAQTVINVIFSQLAEQDAAEI
jgi:hypothetical protein